MKVAFSSLLSMASLVAFVASAPRERLSKKQDALDSPRDHFPFSKKQDALDSSKDRFPKKQEVLDSDNSANELVEIEGLPGSRVPRHVAEMIRNAWPAASLKHATKRGLDGFQWVELPGIKGSKVPDFIAYWFTLPYQYMWQAAQDMYHDVEYGPSEEQQARKRGFGGLPQKTDDSSVDGSPQKNDGSAQ